jgi:hypothetical protein
VSCLPELFGLIPESFSRVLFVSDSDAFIFPIFINSLINFY